MEELDARKARDIARRLGVTPQSAHEVPTPDALPTMELRHLAAIAATTSNGLKFNEANVLRYLALLDAGNGVAFSERRMADVLRIGRNTLRRALKALADRGLVSVSRTSHTTTVDVLVVRQPGPPTGGGPTQEQP